MKEGKKEHRHLNRHALLRTCVSISLLLESDISCAELARAGEADVLLRDADDHRVPHHTQVPHHTEELRTRLDGGGGGG